MWSYTYTHARQIASKALPEVFHWTPAAPVADAYIANGLNQYTSVGGNTYAYDANANLTARTVGSQAWSHAYDGENRLLSTAWVEGGVNKTNAYVYDGQDRRVRVTNKQGLNATYLWAQQNIIAEYDNAGNLARRYVYGAGMDEPVAMYTYDSSGSETGLQYYHQDALGSVVAMTDGTSGNLVEHYSYSSHGEVGAEGTAGNPFRYTGRQLDPDTGLYYYRARYYAADMGRFLQVDPIGYKDSLNLYQYALWDPITNKDPSGNATVYIDNTGKQVLIIQNFNNKTQFKDADISAMGAGMSGKASDGTNVTTQLVPVAPGTADTINLTTNAKLDDTSANGADRSHINSIGGREAQIAPNAAGPATAGHEIGHGIGAGDQYKGGVGTDGKTLTADVPGAANMMKTSGETQMNPQSLTEMKNAPTNTIVNCPGDLGASGCK